MKKEPPIILTNRSAQAPPQPQGPHPSSWAQLIESRATMLGLLFCVTGCLGIPFLWMSSKFSRSEKIVWSIVVTIYTLVLIAITWAICWWSYAQIRQSL